MTTNPAVPTQRPGSRGRRGRSRSHPSRASRAGGCLRDDFLRSREDVHPPSPPHPDRVARSHGAAHRWRGLGRRRPRGCTRSSPADGGPLLPRVVRSKRRGGRRPAAVHPSDGSRLARSLPPQRHALCPTSKIQNVVTSEGPWQRRLGLASVHLSSAGGPALVARHRDGDEAMRIANRVLSSSAHLTHLPAGSA
ncbi:PH domain-containing protein [Streptomyces sp. NPDC002553]|uniref:PH domain-containing protein n=1 Tax=Streptomyces sp. NPDC002553 TaxID=3154417 RepID=UPI003333EB21